MKSIFKTLLVTSTLLLSLNASATVIFNFEDYTPPDNNHSVNYMQGGLTLTVEAFNGGVDANVHTAVSGLGVTGGPGKNLIHSPEKLAFSLDQAFDGVVTILFSAWNHKDSAIIEFSSGGSTTAAGVADTSFDFNLSGTAGFSIAAVDVNPNNDDDSFRIREIQFARNAANLISEPSTLALVSLSLIAGLRLFRRK